MIAVVPWLDPVVWGTALAAYIVLTLIKGKARKK